MELFINNEAYAYQGVYQKIGKLPGLSGQDRIWVIFGAALYEMVTNKGFKDILVYTDTDLAIEWSGECKSDKAKKVRDLIKKMTLTQNVKVRLEKVDSLSLRDNILRFKTVKE